MKKRRRKKKKVKKADHTNSKESINEMALWKQIEVLSSDDDDTGSEYYSTDDEDSVDEPSKGSPRSVCARDPHIVSPLEVRVAFDQEEPAHLMFLIYLTYV
jgi:hypothetical protein